MEEGAAVAARRGEELERLLEVAAARERQQQQSLEVGPAALN